MEKNIADIILLDILRYTHPPIETQIPARIPLDNIRITTPPGFLYIILVISVLDIIKLNNNPTKIHVEFC